MSAGMWKASISRFGSASTELGESPVWSVAEQAIYWIDWQNRLVYRQDWSSDSCDSWSFDGRIGCLAPHRETGIVLAMDFGFFAFDPVTRSVASIARLPDTEVNGLNDGRCDRKGRFWCGTWDAQNRQTKGRIYCLETTGECRPSGPLVKNTNGIAWSPAQDTIYFADSHERLIFSATYDLERGEIGDHKVFAEVPPPGLPDGAVIDASGCLWSAEYGGKRLVRYSPTGLVDRVVELPVAFPTSCVFGGPDLSILFVTTALGPEADGDTSDELEGSLLTVDVGVDGFAEVGYAGPRVNPFD